MVMAFVTIATVSMAEVVASFILTDNVLSEIKHKGYILKMEGLMFMRDKSCGL